MAFAPVLGLIEKHELETVTPEAMSEPTSKCARTEPGEMASAEARELMVSPDE